MGSNDLGASKRKRGLHTETGAQDDPPAKRPTGSHLVPAGQERIRSAVATLYQSFNTLCNAQADRPDLAAFRAVLKASEGDVASRRLSARLVPRFIVQFPDEVVTAAAILTRLCENRQAQDPKLKSLEEHTRHDALHGLANVLQAAQASGGKGESAVKLVLGFLLRLLPQAASDEPSEPEEEGELAPYDKSTTTGPAVRKLLHKALQLHPSTTLAYCCSWLGPEPPSVNNGSSNSSSIKQADQQLKASVRLFVKDYLLKERTPSRASTPPGGDMAVHSAAADNGADELAALAREAEECNGGGNRGHSCRLQDVLNASEELQAWVMQQAKGRAAAPPEVRSLLETALQLLPPDKQLSAAKPKLHHGLPSSPASATSRQHPALASVSSLPLHQQQHLANGVAPGMANGSSLGRFWSIPGSGDKGSKGQPLPSKQDVRLQFPQPPGPICRVEPCLLAFNLPPHITRAEVQAALGADEIWLMENQAPGAGISACCTFKGVLDAAKAYLRHNGSTRFGLGRLPLKLVFTDRLPRGSKQVSAAVPSVYIWATKEAVGDAESITDQLRDVGMQLQHVHRVNNVAEPGTLLQTPSAKHAAEVVAYLLQKHPQPHGAQAAAAAAAQQDGQELPPLPPESPPAGQWQSSSSNSSSKGTKQQHQQDMPPLPPGPPPPVQQQYSGLRRSYSGPGPPVPPATAAGVSAWRDSPTDKAAIGTRAGQPSPQRQQQQQRGGIPVPAPPPLPPGALAVSPSVDGMNSSYSRQGDLMSPGWHTGSPHYGVQQQQHGWGAQPPLASPQQQQQQQQQQQRVGRQHGGRPMPPHAPLGQPPQSANQHSMGPSNNTAHGRVLWRGSIVKQSVHMCGVACLDGGLLSPDAPMAGFAAEPRFWPDQLHVNYRISIGDAVEQYAHCLPEQRAIRRLLPLNPEAGDLQQLQQFISYLNGKDRAGMVKLPPLREQGLGPRLVYLVVPKPHICEHLQVMWDGRAVMLLAVVVPQPGGAAACGAGAAPLGAVAGSYGHGHGTAHRHHGRS